LLKHSSMSEWSGSFALSLIKAGRDDYLDIYPYIDCNACSLSSFYFLFLGQFNEMTVSFIYNMEGIFVGNSASAIPTGG